MPGRARDPHGERVARDPVVRDDDRARPQASQRRRPVEGERDDRVVHRHRGDGEVVALRVPHEDPYLARPELDASDVELVRRRRRSADELDDAVAERDDDRHREGEADERDEGPEPPCQAAGRLGARCRHGSSTWKYPIQPSSVNSDWWAWNMNVPAWANRTSSTPRWPWHCITVSVYSQCSPVPVGW